VLDSGSCPGKVSTHVKMNESVDLKLLLLSVLSARVRAASTTGFDQNMQCHATSMQIAFAAVPIVLCNAMPLGSRLAYSVLYRTPLPLRLS
jgi:hypothetical protein